MLTPLHISRYPTKKVIMQDGAEVLVTKLDVEAAKQESAQRNAALAAEHDLRLRQQTKVLSCHSAEMRLHTPCLVST